MARVSGRPVHLNTLTLLPHAPDGWQRSLEFAQAASEVGLDVHPMFATNRQGAHFSLDSTFLFDEMPSFRDTLTLPEPRRSLRLRDHAVRDQMRKEIADPTGRSFVFVWQVVAVEIVHRPEHDSLVGRTVSDIAAEQHKDPLDVFLDLSLAEDLQMQFVLAAPPNKKRQAVTEALIRSPLVMAGSSDGGAHLLSFCGADFTTRLITDWTPAVLPIEDAIARLTAIPARAYGIVDRGTLEVGKAADVLLIDRDRLSAGDTPRYVRDFPAASGRYVVDATGYHSVIVNGQTLLRDGADTGHRPGVVLRPFTGS
jgi:N-acyl-D-aspartate/D-glutamate deacylase